MVVLWNWPRAAADSSLLNVLCLHDFYATCTTVLGFCRHLLSGRCGVHGDDWVDVRLVGGAFGWCDSGGGVIDCGDDFSAIVCAASGEGLAGAAANLGGVVPARQPL